jgi:hypothetical protein
MDKIMSQAWVGTFEDAFREFDRKKLTERIALAQAAIDGRLYDLQADFGRHEERRLIAHALRTLGLLRSCASGVGLSGQEDEDDEEEEEEEDPPNKEPPEEEEDIPEGYSE